MKAYRIVCIMVLLGFMAIGAFVATEFIAYRFGFSKALGLPIYNSIIPVYSPFSACAWFVKYYNHNPQAFMHAGYIFAGCTTIGFLPVFLLSIVNYRHNKISDTYGSARWATKAEIKKLGLTKKHGVVLGKLPGLGVLSHDGPEHILVNAPTRSGKGVGIIIPTLLSWPSSVLVLDIKKENWAVTAGFRSKFSHVICFDPTSMDGACWNPLLEVRKGINEVKDVQNIADVLVDPDGSSKQRDHWAKTGHALLVATILHVLYAEDDKTLSGVANFLANPKRDICATLKYMQATRHVNNKPHPVVASATQEMLNKSEGELSGVLSTAMSFLGLYRDPVVARNTVLSRNL